MITQSGNVKDLYEKFPYPSNVVGKELIYDLVSIVGLLLNDLDKDNIRILDLGCGTGHRLAALAEQYPNIELVGVDMTDRSISIAQELALVNGLTNISFVLSRIEDISFKEEFDFVISTGVFHHMEAPQIGFENSFKALKKDGVALIWLYHEIGEYYRLVDRELVQLFLRRDLNNSIEFDLNLLRSLNKSISSAQYGNSSAHIGKKTTLDSIIDADAFLHPIVNAYNFNSFREMFTKAGFADVFLAGLNREGESKIISFQDCQEQYFTLNIPELFCGQEELLDRFHEFDYDLKIRAIELAWRPSGITCLGMKTGGSRARVNQIVIPN